MLAGTFFHTGLGLGLGLGFLEEDLHSDLDLPTEDGLGLGLGLEDSGLGLALKLGCCWTCYKSGSLHSIRLVTPECTRGVIDPLYHSRHNGRDWQYECDRGIRWGAFTCVWW